MTRHSEMQTLTDGTRLRLPGRGIDVGRLGAPLRDDAWKSERRDSAEGDHSRPKTSRSWRKDGGPECSMLAKWIVGLSTLLEDQQNFANR